MLTCAPGYFGTKPLTIYEVVALDCKFAINSSLYVFSVVTCIPDEVPNSTKTPDQTTYDYLTSVTYTCNTGYGLTSGNGTRICQADATWSNSPPVCTGKTVKHMNIIKCIIHAMGW